MFANNSYKTGTRKGEIKPHVKARTYTDFKWVASPLPVISPYLFSSISDLVPCEFIGVVPFVLRYITSQDIQKKIKAKASWCIRKNWKKINKAGVKVSKNEEQEWKKCIRKNWYEIEKICNPSFELCMYALRHYGNNVVYIVTNVDVYRLN